MSADFLFKTTKFTEVLLPCAEDMTLLPNANINKSFYFYFSKILHLGKQLSFKFSPQSITNINNLHGSNKIASLFQWRQSLAQVVSKMKIHLSYRKSNGRQFIISLYSYLMMPSKTQILYIVLQYHAQFY